MKNYLTDGKYSIYSFFLATIFCFVWLFHDLLAPRPLSSIIAVISFLKMVALIFISLTIGRRNLVVGSTNHLLARIGYWLSVSAIVVSSIMLFLFVLVSLG